MTDVQVRLRKAGVRPDDRAGARFLTALRVLRGAVPASGTARRAECDAALALLGLAAAGAEAELATYLSPDPDRDQVTWTTVCYQVGDLSPSAIRDFAGPIDALGHLLCCDDDRHLAAELVASCDTGVRWTALVRTGDRLCFQLPGPETVRGNGRGSHVEDALARWSRQLAVWSRTATATVDDRTGDPATRLDGPGAGARPRHAADPAASPPGGAPRDLDRGPALVTLPAEDLAGRSDPAADRRAGGPAVPADDRAGEDRLDAVARSLALLAGRVGDLAAATTAGHRELDRRLDGLTAGLDGSTAGADGSASGAGPDLVERLDDIVARLDALADRLARCEAALALRATTPGADPPSGGAGPATVPASPVTARPEPLASR
ncbi:MAG: hypothetical protein AB7L84_03815 [Acidimicrobiia bacterium]